MPKIPLKLTVLESRLTDLVSQAQLVHNCFTRVLDICVFLNIFDKLIKRYGVKMTIQEHIEHYFVSETLILFVFIHFTSWH